MVLYKVPFTTRVFNLKHSLAQRMKQFYDRALRFDMLTPYRTLHQFNSKTHLSSWTLITDTIFGGKSDCELVKTNNNSCVFQGQLYTLTNGKKVLPSFARMWFVVRFRARIPHDEIHFDWKYLNNFLKNNF